MLEDMFYGATYDDFLFRPEYGILKSRRGSDLSMPFSRNIKISAPIVGANMDTVTREKMVKTLSLEECFGFLDRNCPIEDQVARVRHVKRQYSFVIDNPVVVHSKNTIEEARNIITGQNVSSLLVENSPGNGVLAGILTHRDIIAAEGREGMLVENFMTPFRRIITAKPGIAIGRAEKIMAENRIEKLPLINKDRKIKGLITIRDIQVAKQKPYSTKDDKGRLMVGAAIGSSGDFMERAEALISAEADCILMATAMFLYVNTKRRTEKIKAELSSLVLPLVAGDF